MISATSKGAFSFLCHSIVRSRPTWPNRSLTWNITARLQGSPVSLKSCIRYSMPRRPIVELVVKTRNTYFTPCWVSWSAEPMSITRGTGFADCLITWIMALMLPLSNAPTRTWHPSRMSRSVSARATSGLYW